MRWEGVGIMVTVLFEGKPGRFNYFTEVISAGLTLANFDEAPDLRRTTLKLMASWHVLRRPALVEQVSEVGPRPWHQISKGRASGSMGQVSRGRLCLSSWRMAGLNEQGLSALNGELV